MIDSTPASASAPSRVGSAGLLSGSAPSADMPSGVVAELTALVDRLGALPAAVDDAERIDRIAALERLRGAVAAAQARETVAFAASQLAAQAAAGVRASRRGRGIPEQLGLARRLSPAAAARELTFAGDLVAELPAIAGLLGRGEIAEWTAKEVARETRDLPPETRDAITAGLAPELPSRSTRQAAASARRAAHTADPKLFMRRGRTARTDRGVSIRPAPDTMAVLSAFLPVEQGVAAWANLDQTARTAKAHGDPRTLGQLRADNLVQRLTGQATADAVPVEVGLTMTADSLLGSDTTPAQILGHGPIPVDLALDIVGRAAGPGPAPTTASDRVTDPDPQDSAPRGVTADDIGVAVWVRRIFTDPIDDTVIHVDTGRRRFDRRLARLIRYRDQTCRELYCDAPIRHLDHVHPHRDGGPTTPANGAGLCERGNYTKDMPGWTHTVTSPPGQTQRIQIRTPTGHTYTSVPPPALGHGGNHRQLDHRAERRRELLQRLRPIRVLTALPLRPIDPPRRN